MFLELACHPDTPGQAVDRVRVSVVRHVPGLLRLTYMVVGDIDMVLVPEPADPVRRDDLWQHTCFEAFARGGDGSDYVEINLSPSTEWAAYTFDAYRAGRTVLAAFPAPEMEVVVKPPVLGLVATTDLTVVPGLSGGRSWRLGLSAVIEEKGGTRSYWALNHPPGVPDFHHDDCFALELAPPA